MRHLSRRGLIQGAGAAVGVGALAACGGVAGGGSGGADGGLRYAFWGNNVRQTNYQKAFDLMAEQNEELALKVEFAEYSAFQERMTTQMAAGNVADIFWVPSPQVMTYYSNGLYRPLEGVESLDLSDYSDGDIQDFLLDGEHNTMPFGIFVPVVRYNATFVEEDGLDWPESWDWDGFAEFAKEYATQNEDRWAVAYAADADLCFEGWLRQHGEELWNEEGRIGYTQEGLESWIAWWEDLRQAGATPSIGEQDGVGASWEDVGDRCLAWFSNSNHIVDDSTMFPDYDFALSHLPVDPSAPDGHQFLYFPRQAIYAKASDANAELAGEVFNFTTGDVEMLKTVGLTMGAPVNPRVAEEYTEFASPVETAMLEVVAEDREADRTARFEAPPGSSTWRDVMTRALENVTNGNATIPEASQAMIEEISTGIERASGGKG
ncbi:ABC transporter substrate-binding protein [Brachybacterium ginsengisoli]|uniref:ABC transporter substrate-binding protein n=1 Tax=Brachybacterium ginsengisoli TaxID=1331682 RepID=A0A291H0C4_9MICO|nr:extracellular solute-binding protein [Brachybacterium ginsengisoli]ATG55806.1 ABC transporter substrate-binding protein [Brachybacterium ginsengisoli]